LQPIQKLINAIISPEIFRQENHLFSGDIWSVVCVIHLLMTRETGLFEFDEGCMKGMIFNQKPNFNERNYFDGMQYVIKEMVKKESKERKSLQNIQNFFYLYDKCFQVTADNSNIQKDGKEKLEK
jgi:hypothetical protein